MTRLLSAIARSAVLISLAIFASACASLPQAELHAYTDAFEATRNAAEPLLADYAIAERSERLLAIQNDANRHYSENRYLNSFQVSDVAAVSDAALPPGAAAIDRAFRGIGRYNETLVALAENRNVDEARAQLNQAIDDLGAIAPAVGKMPVLKPTADFIVNLLKPAIVKNNREEFRRIVLDAQPSVKSLIGVLRDYTPTQYDIATSALQAEADDLPDGPDHDKIAEKINAWHKTYGNYVALLDALERRVDELADAVRYPKSQPFLQRAAAGAHDLRNYTDALRLSLAALRTKP